MQGWMIALIVVAAVILFLAVAVLVGSLIAVDKVLGRARKAPKGETPEKYGVDPSWFDTDEIKSVTKKLEITSYDGLTLRALRLTHGEADALTHKVAIMQHGYGASPRSMQPYARILFERGFDVILPAARAHDISDGKYIGMAWLDRFDVLRWVDKVIDIYGDKASIVLMGVSMGGSTVAAVSGMEPPPQVKCIVDDCGFSSQKEEYYACLKNVHLPKSLAMSPLTIGVRLKCGYSIYDADITQFVKQSKTPSLFIHGENDTFVPCELGKKMYEACSAKEKQFYLVPFAAHAGAYVANKEKYTEVFTEFVDKYVA